MLDGINAAAEYANMLGKLWTPATQVPNALLILSLAHLLPGLYLLFYASNLVKQIYGVPGEGDAEDPSPKL